MFFIVIQLATQDILKGKRGFHPSGLLSMWYPEAPGLRLLFQEMATRRQHVGISPGPPPTQVAQARKPKENFLLLSPRWEWAIPEAIQSSCLITSSNLQFQLQTSPRACLHHSAEGAPLVGEATPEGGRLWGPRQEARGAGSFQRLSS